jgi:hypothetical protein
MNRSGSIGSWIREPSSGSLRISNRRSASKKRRRNNRLERRHNKLERSITNLLRKKTLIFPN